MIGDSVRAGVRLSRRGHQSSSPSGITLSELTKSRAFRLSLAAAGASLLCTVLATRVFVSFDGLRAKVVKASIEAVDGLVRIDTSFDHRVASLEAPVAVIASIRSTGAGPETVAVSADGRIICEALIPAHLSKRLDCAVTRDWERRGDHRIEIRGASSAWVLDYLELASHHGSSTRALYLLVLPDLATGYGHAGPVLIALAWIAIAAAWLVPVPRRWSPVAMNAYRVACVVVILLLAAAVVSPWVSPFLVLISIGSFVKFVAALLAPQVGQLSVRLWKAGQWVLRHSDRWRPQVAAAATAAVVLLAYGLIIRATAETLEGKYSGLLRVSGQQFDRVPFLHDRADVRQTLKLDPWEGYDAQFQYFAIYDPLLRRYSNEPRRYRDVADAPPYRFGRMGFALLARAVAGGNWQLYPVTMVALVWAGVGLAAFALALLAQRLGASAAWGLLVLAIPGFWQSVQVTLPEPIAAALLLMGYLSVLNKRIFFAALLFAASLLVRETGLVLVLAIALLTSVEDLSRRSRVVLACSALPFVLWRLYVAWVLWPDFGWQGLFYSPHVMTLPFAGLAGLWTDLARGTHHPGVPNLVRGAFWFSMLLVGVCIAALSVARASGRVIGAALAAYALMALSFTHVTVWSHVANGQRASYEVFVLLAVATFSFHRYQTAVKTTLALCWTATLLYLLLGSHDVLLIRGALFPWT